ncbi:MAG: DUF3419 family protein [Geminicoccaceae bacterium]|nr:DUF3419 family protein [Geminicoccaceae bacterium]MCS7267909.1 DUF3419 family protein [Geminicoccaceae bacterium]MDW8124461.1 DUF3419 family protein [Geminicoccaceae bacterium]MDW8342492.1 DUF3419 family protein [Geminicoccaceae bacterium]
MARSLARSVAQTEASWTPRGLLERLFAKAFDGLVYPQIWEDPVVDMEALAPLSGARIAAIASGGCNVMSYLAARPARILAVDLSPAHTALLELKLVAARRLEQPEFFRLFAIAEGAENLALWSRLRGHLSPAARRFWEARTLSGRPRFSAFARGFYRTGLLGRFIGLGHLLLRLHGRDPRRLLAARDRDEQRALFAREIAPLLDSPFLRVLAGLSPVWFGLGIPPAQFDRLKRAKPGGMVAVLRERLERLACAFPLDRNYFAWQAFARRYRPEGPLPPYLEPRHFPLLRSFAGCVQVRRASLADALAEEDAASFDAFVLLDALDWMTPERLAALWAQIRRTAAPGARVIFRTADARSPLEELLPRELRAGWIYEEERSRALFARDRSAIYGGFHLYRRAG